MQTLDTEIRFTGEGHSNNPVLLKQIQRCGRVAIYERSHENPPKGHKSGVQGYEVIIIRTLKVECVYGADLPEREKYPTAKEFGTYGKFVLDLDRAERIFKQWCKEETK